MEWLIAALGPFGGLLGRLLGWRLVRNKAQSEKTWEKRREIYPELISKLRVLKEIVEDRVYRSGRPGGPDRDDADGIGIYVVHQKERGISFEDDAEALKAFVDENGLHISKEMEQIVEAFWTEFCRTRDNDNRKFGARGLDDKARQSILLPAARKAYAEAKAQAETEIRV